jgi:cytoskeletal protein CcmA (bactofilin family)
MAFGDSSKGSKDAAALTAFIDQGSEFSGKLNFKDTVRIDGRFDGEIASDNTLIVGETGRVFAQIKSGDVIVSGEVKGDIAAVGRVTLHRSARVNGNVSAARLVIEEGAELNGQISMNGNSPAHARPGAKPGDEKLLKMQA